MILYRKTSETAVAFQHRQVDVVAVPYSQVITADDGDGRYREAFDPRVLIELLREPIPALLHHDPMQPFGHVQIHGAGPEGLRATLHAARIPAGDEALALADAGVLYPSIGFSGTSHETRSGVKWRTGIVLHEVSLVTFQAYHGATVTGVRSSGAPTPRLQQAEGLRNIYRNRRAVE